MSFLVNIAVLASIAAGGFLAGIARARAVSAGRRSHLHSLPVYHGLWVALVGFLPAAFFLHVAVLFEPFVVDLWIRHSLAEALSGISHDEGARFLTRAGQLAVDPNLYRDTSPAELAAAEAVGEIRTAGATWIAGITRSLALAGVGFALWRVAREFRARNASERVVVNLLALCALVAVMTTVCIVLTLVAESARFFAMVSPIDFFFGLHWSPQAALRAQQLGVAAAFGIVPVFAGTMLISLVAMLVAAPIGIFSAIYMVEFADPALRRVVKPVIELLAGIPTVVYGFFAAIAVAPLVRNMGEGIGFEVSANSALAAGGVMGIMIIPFVSSLADDVIGTVPSRLREAAYSLGATKAETVVRVVLPAALPGLLSAMVLAVSRALGETMIVVMAAGLFAHLTLNPLDAVTTVTAQITSVLTGDQPFDSPTTLSAFALGLTLFATTLVMNSAALRLMESYRERYE